MAADRQDEFPEIALIGFGEAAHAIAGHWARPEGLAIRAYDPKFADDADPARGRCEAIGVTAAQSAGEALDAAGLVFCLVTADRSLDAAQEGAAHIAPGAFWLDGNSCAPQTKQQAAAVIEAAGGRYVDMAVMAPVYPARHQVPLLLSGPHGQAALPLLERLGMRPRLAGARVGEASSIKMLRSVMIKGLEALTAECLLAARRVGVEESVIASLVASDAQIDWRSRGAYNLERMLVHGERRAAEMAEVCVMLEALGLPDRMSRATVDWQRQLAALSLEPGEADLGARADRILARL